MLFLAPNQQFESTEGKLCGLVLACKKYLVVHCSFELLHVGILEKLPLPYQ